MAVDNEVDTYVSYRSIGLNTIKVFDYIQPLASAKSSVAGSVPPCSSRLNPPPTTPTPSVTPPATLPTIPEAE